MNAMMPLAFLCYRQMKGNSMMNTKIEYLYRDADNYKVHNECVIVGPLSAEQINMIIGSLEDEEYFIPHMVGLPEKRFDTYDPQSDHPYFELTKDGFSETEAPATVELEAPALVAAFLRCKGAWEQIEPMRLMELLNLLIDDKVNDEGGHGGRVAEKLVDLGFTKKELLILQFTESDIDRAMKEDEDV